MAGIPLLFQSAKLGSFVYVKENSTLEARAMKTAVDDVIEGANFTTHVHAESYVSLVMTAL